MIVAGRGLQAASVALRIGAGWCLNRAADCAIIALRWRRPLLAGMVAAPVLAWAAPPAGSDPNSAAAAWFRGLRDVRGVSCCDEADCRRTMIRPAGEGVEAWIGREAFGGAAPDEWRAIPAHELRSRGDRPAGVRGAIVCFYAGRVACADVESGS
jgi:hypothetical protein